MVGVIVLFIRNYTPPSSIKWVIVPNVMVASEELCNSKNRLYPSTLHNWALPASSPDGKYYVDIADSRLTGMKIIKLFRKDDKKEVGRYFSEYSDLKIYCWTEDSSGIYVADYEPSRGFGGIFTPSPKTGPVKKLLVP